MAANSSIQTLAGTLSARLKALTNPILKKICKEEGLQQSGNKPVLQKRILDLIDEAARSNDADALQRFRHRIFNAGEAPPSGSISSSTPTYPTHASPAAPTAYNGFHPPFPPAQHHMAPRPQHLFKESAFYELRQILVDGIVLEVSPNHRQNCQKTIELRHEICDRLKSDPSLRILLFSAADQPLTGYTRLDVSFPSQIEVRVNGDEVKANYKGLKNKPGSTRPADITDFVRKMPNYKNTLLITYALTPKKFNLQVCMVKQNSVQDLARQISNKNVITKQTVVNEMLKKANDPDIVVGSSIMSLKDPVSTVRISIPIRSTICSHNQCFDAKSFLQLQEQAPTWICPICNKTISFEALAVDEYFKEILDNVPKDTDQVTVEPDGRWTNEKEKSTPKHNGYGYNASPDTDDDLVEISGYRVAAIKSEAYTPQSLTHTPPLSSREASTAPRTGSKRGSEVIDLTLSDEDEPVRPTKKVAYSTPNSLPEPSRRYQLPFGTPSIPSRPQPQPINPMSPGLRQEPPLNHPSFGAYRPPPPRSSYSGQGTSTYPTYLGSSP